MRLINLLTHDRFPLKLQQELLTTLTQASWRVYSSGCKNYLRY